MTGWTRYCSLACANKVLKPRRSNQYGSPLTAEQKRAKKRAKDRRRRMRLQLVAWDGVSDEEILERDRWMCWICKRRIGKTFKYPHPRSASIDHVIPLALGGDDTAFNKKAAHLRCNIARQTGGPDEHPMLNFSLDPNVEIALRKRGKPCVTCGAIPGSDCKLHMPVRYFTCRKCQRLFVDHRLTPAYCSPECSRSARYARHDEKVKRKPAHQRGLEARAMHDAGMEWDEIAGRLGYSGAPYAAAAAARAVGRRSKRRTAPYARVPRGDQRLTA